MRIPSLVIATLGLSMLTACTSTPEKVAGDAGPAGSPAPTASASSSASAAAPSKSARAPVPASASRSAGPPTSGRTSAIRRTDWANVTLVGLGFQGFGDARFRGGTATSGANTCTMLPGSARPFYAEYLTEEPANSPVTEDALVLVECGSDGLDQALVPVKLVVGENDRFAIGFIPADPATGPGKRMTFTSYRVDGGVIVTTVRRTDGSRETRRYRFGGGNRWERI